MNGDKLRIFHVNTERAIRGGELQMLMLAEELRSRGHENHLFLQQNSAVIEEAQDRGLEHQQLRMRGEWDFIAARRLRRAMHRLRPQIVHAHTSHAGSVALLSRAFDRNPAVVMSRRVSLPLKKNPLTVYKYRAVDAVLTVSPLIARRLIAAGLPKQRIFVAESGTDFSRFENTLSREQVRSSLGIPSHAFVIGNVAHFDKTKGHLLLIQAFAQLMRRNPAVLYYLLLIGEGPTLDECKHFANRLDLSERILFAGYRRDIENYYRVMDVFFLSTLPKSMSEGWSGVVREAMACSVPVIAVRQPSLEEQINHSETGLLVPFDELKAWTDAIDQLQTDRALRMKLANAAQHSVKEFSIQRMADQTEKCYREVLENQISPEKSL